MTLMIKFNILSVGGEERNKEIKPHLIWLTPTSEPMRFRSAHTCVCVCFLPGGAAVPALGLSQLL